MSKLKVEEEWRISNSNLYKCPSCEKIYRKSGIVSHFWAAHTEKGLEHIKRLKTLKKNITSFWKGKTKESCPQLAEISRIKKEKYASGQLSRKGYFHTEETKKKLSEARIKWCRENPDKVPFILNGWKYPRSYLELRLEKELIKEGIKGWVPNYQNGMYKYDFAFPEIKVDLEVDGSQHEQHAQKEHDKIRDEWSISQGWKVLRVKGTVIKHNLPLAIQSIKEFIGPDNLTMLQSIDIDEFLKKKKEEGTLEADEKNLRKVLQKIKEKNLKVNFRILRRTIQETRRIDRKYAFSFNLIKLKMIENRRASLKFIILKCIVDNNINIMKHGWIEKISKLTSASLNDVQFIVREEFPSAYSPTSLNSQFGSMWITNGVYNMKIKKEDEIPEGFQKGRKQSLPTLKRDSFKASIA